MQSAWAIGYGAAAVVTGFVLPRWGWRAVFFVGVLPALLTLWVRRGVAEPAIWRRSDGAAGRAACSASATSSRGGRLRLTIAVTLMNACTMFAWWGFNLWMPGYLRCRPPGRRRPEPGDDVRLRRRHAGRHVVRLRHVRLRQRRLGRRRTYVIYLLAAAASDPGLRVGAIAAGAAAARPVRRVLRDRLLQRLRRGDRGDLSDRDPRHRAGVHLQHRPHRQRRRAVRGRHAGPDARLRRRAVDLLGGASCSRRSSGSGSRRRAGGRWPEGRAASRRSGRTMRATIGSLPPL